MQVQLRTKNKVQSQLELSLAQISPSLFWLINNDEQKIITTEHQEEAIMDEMIGIVSIIKGEQILIRIEIKVA